jgi:predicted aspartyl protease
MSVFVFDMEGEDSLIRVDAELGYSDFTLALDTGATHTVIDLTVMLMNGFSLKDAIKTVEFETAKGVVSAYVFKVKSLKILGVVKKNVEIASYDFIGNNVILDIDGVVGLDFFKNTELIINFKKFTITLK